MILEELIGNLNSFSKQAIVQVDEYVARGELSNNNEFVDQLTREGEGK